MNEKLTPDIVAQVTADITAATETADFKYLLREAAFYRMAPLFSVAGISPHTAIGHDLAAALMATMEVAAEAGALAYLAHTQGVSLPDMVGAVMPDTAPDLTGGSQVGEGDEDENTPADDLAEAIRAALEEYLASAEEEDDLFDDDFERDAYRELKPAFKALDHSTCRGITGCVHREWFSSELDRRAAELRARAAAPESEPAVTAPLTPEQQDRRYPGLPRGSDD